MNHLRVWEETWDRTDAGLRFSLGDALDFGLDAQNQARAELTAKAPEMARMLMLLAGMGTDKYCNGCGDTSKHGHKRDCSLVQLLHDAGIGRLSQADRSPCLALVP